MAFLADYEDICQFSDASGLCDICLSIQVQMRNQSGIREILGDYFHITAAGPSAWLGGIPQELRFVYSWDVLRAGGAGEKS